MADDIRGYLGVLDVYSLYIGVFYPHREVRFAPLPNTKRKSITLYLKQRF